MDTKGGRVSIQIGGATHTARANVKIMNSAVERENAANLNGSGSSMVKPVLPRVEMTFDRGERLGLEYDDAFVLAEHNVTVIEEDSGFTHLFTGASVSGKPELDTATGEIAGIAFEVGRGGYQKVAG